MPLPAELKKKAPKAMKKDVMAKTMKDLKEGPHHKDRTHKQEVAIGMKQSGQSKKKTPDKKGSAIMAFKKKSNKDAHRMKRNIGRK
jgi:hypothetical protein